MILGLAVLLSLGTADVAARNGDAVINVEQPEVVCDTSIPNQITVTVFVATNVDLDGLWVQASRWEDVKTTMPDWPARFDSVEYWAADFTADKGGTVPTSHTLKSSDPTTWTHHGWIRDGYYTDTSEIFVVNVNAWTKRKSKRGQVISAWTVDCNTSPATVIPFTYPWDVPWDHD